MVQMSATSCLIRSQKDRLAPLVSNPCRIVGPLQQSADLGELTFSGSPSVSASVHLSPVVPHVPPPLHAVSRRYVSWPNFSLKQTSKKQNRTKKGHFSGVSSELLFRSSATARPSWFYGEELLPILIDQ